MYFLLLVSDDAEALAKTVLPDGSYHVSSECDLALRREDIWRRFLKPALALLQATALKRDAIADAMAEAGLSLEQLPEDVRKELDNRAKRMQA